MIINWRIFFFFMVFLLRNRMVLECYQDLEQFFFKLLYLKNITIFESLGSLILFLFLWNRMLSNRLSFIGENFLKIVESHLLLKEENMYTKFSTSSWFHDEYFKFFEFLYSCRCTNIDECRTHWYTTWKDSKFSFIVSQFFSRDRSIRACVISVDISNIQRERGVV